MMGMGRRLKIEQSLFHVYGIEATETIGIIHFVHATDAGGGLLFYKLIYPLFHGYILTAKYRSNEVGNDEEDHREE